VCNLYSMTTNQEAIRQLFAVDIDRLGNLPALPDIFPDQTAPVVREGPDGRELLAMRWGFPPESGSRPITNARHLSSAVWRDWLEPAFRCLVPATSFCEWTDTRPKVPHWFALTPERPVFAFAGLWRPWTGTRKGQSGEHLLFAFLTTAANADVKPIHAKAMPVVLRTPQARAAWMSLPAAEIRRLQRPLPDGALAVVATGATSDPAV